MKIAISVGDPNGIGLEIALRAHEEVAKLCEPIYCINRSTLYNAAALLGVDVPENFHISVCGVAVPIEPGEVSELSGKFSYDSFNHAISLVKEQQASAVVTLPIHKEAWSKAGIFYKGHTDMLRDVFDQEAIMMLGTPKMYVALFSEHIPLKDVVASLNAEKLTSFLITLYNETKYETIDVLGINPHAGDNGVLGDEEQIIREAIDRANEHFNKTIFNGPLVPDTAFTPQAREGNKLYVAMYHDQGLAPLKALHFDESINVSLGLPIVRTSVDHGTAFDIAYKDKNPKTMSYINAIKTAIAFAKEKKHV
jgi:4-hydroxythreonine-4-phosphate dehydrogenase